MTHRGPWKGHVHSLPSHCFPLVTHWLGITADIWTHSGRASSSFLLSWCFPGFIQGFSARPSWLQPVEGGMRLLLGLPFPGGPSSPFSLHVRPMSAHNLPPQPWRCSTFPVLSYLFCRRLFEAFSVHQGPVLYPQLQETQSKFSGRPESLLTGLGARSSPPSGPVVQTSHVELSQKKIFLDIFLSNS